MSISVELVGVMHALRIRASIDKAFVNIRKGWQDHLVPHPNETWCPRLKSFNYHSFCQRL